MNEQLAQIWERSLQLLAEELSRPSFEVWLKESRPLSLEGSTLVVELPSPQAREWVETRYRPLLEKALSRVTGAEHAIRLTVSSSEKKKPGAFPPSGLEAVAPAGEDQGAQLNPRYTFDTFVVGDSNRFAHAAAIAVAESPARAYNPLFIYGGVGLGKTHLMHAIGHYVQSLYPTMKVLYVTSERFTNELINSIRDDRTAEFRTRYRSIDLLLVDDIQFLAGKERTQEEFFHTFNALYEANKQIVISSDRPPREIPTLEDRLRSRFEWGLMTDIQAPDLETRIAILRKKASLEKIDLPNEVSAYIAKNISSNIRELEGALIRVIAYSALKNAEISLSLAAEALKDLLPSPRHKQISIESIQEAVAHYFGIDQEEMRAKKRTRTVSFPRQVAMYIARELTEASLPKIGEAFGGRDHTTVLHACEKVQEAIANDPNLDRAVKSIMQRLQNT